MASSSTAGAAGGSAPASAEPEPGSALEAVVVALAEPGGAVLGGDLKDLRALAAHADGVTVRRA